MQTLTATVAGGTVYVAVFYGGAAISNVTYSCPGGATCNINVFPAAPAALGPGSFTGAVTVYGCADSNCNTQVGGSPQVVNVNYQIAATPAQVSTVAPYVATTNTAGDVILRGISFSQVAVQNVLFNSTPATSFSAISDTEVRATHPALPAGSYAVTLQTASGTVASTATLVVVDAPGFVAPNLLYPNPTSKKIVGMVYDAERQALLVAVNYPADRTTNQVLRYPFSSGSWQAPATIVNLRDLTLSPNGAKLLALADTSLTELNPSTLAAGITTNANFSSSFEYFKNLVMANDSNAVITSGWNGSGSTPVYLYNTGTPGFAVPTASGGGVNSIAYGTPGASADGSRVALIQGFISPPQPVYEYLASTGTLAPTAVNLNQKSVPSDLNIAPAMNRAGSRVVLDNTGGTHAYDINQSTGSYTVISGALPSTTLAVVLSPDGQFAYTYDSAASVRKFNLSVVPVLEVGAPGTPVSNAGSTAKMTISPDGGTLFVAGSDLVIVMPAP